VQNFLHKRMVGGATGTLIVPELNESQLGIFGSAEVSATFDVQGNRSGIRFGRLVRLTAQKHCGTKRGGNRKNDHDNRLYKLRHGPHTSAPITFAPKVF